MKAIFPDEKSLQPIPTKDGIHPNISGNINSTTGTPVQAQKTDFGLDVQSGLSNKTQNEITSDKNASFYVMWSLIIFFAVCIVIFVYKKLKQR